MQSTNKTNSIPIPIIANNEQFEHYKYRYYRYCRCK